MCDPLYVEIDDIAAAIETAPDHVNDASHLTRGRRTYPAAQHDFLIDIVEFSGK
jgi:hypothetical protein